MVSIKEGIAAEIRGNQSAVESWTKFRALAKATVTISTIEAPIGLRIDSLRDQLIIKLSKLKTSLILKRVIIR